MGRKRKTPSQFWAQVQRGKIDECWEWTGELHRDGYGKTSWNGKTISTHRLAYLLTYGSIPEGSGYHGTVIRHSCDNRLCCNPAHLQAGTIGDNNRDTVVRKRHRFVSNPPKGEKSPVAKLTEADVREIRQLRKTTRITFVELGKRYGVHFSTIQYAVNGKNWKHLNETEN